MKTTLNKIRACSPCESGWETLLKFLGKTKADDGESRQLRTGKNYDFNKRFLRTGILRILPKAI
jgi:hypothetical protein